MLTLYLCNHKYNLRRCLFFCSSSQVVKNVVRGKPRKASNGTICLKNEINSVLLRELNNLSSTYNFFNALISVEVEAFVTFSNNVCSKQYRVALWAGSKPKLRWVILFLTIGCTKWLSLYHKKRMKSCWLSSTTHW